MNEFSLNQYVFGEFFRLSLKTTIKSESHGQENLKSTLLNLFYATTCDFMPTADAENRELILIFSANHTQILKET